VGLVVAFIMLVTIMFLHADGDETVRQRWVYLCDAVEAVLPASGGFSVGRCTGTNG
jgi:hypothetical protein